MFLYETFVISQKTIYMRHIHLLLAGFLLCICCTLQAKNRVIDQPAFIVRNTTSIEVSKVVISDTATVRSTSMPSIVPSTGYRLHPTAT